MYEITTSSKHREWFCHFAFVFACNFYPGFLENLLKTSKIASHNKPPQNIIQSVLRWLNSYNFDARLDYDYTTSSKHQKPAL